MVWVYYAGVGLLGYVVGVIGGTTYSTQQLASTIQKMPEPKRKFVIEALTDPEAPMSFIPVPSVKQLVDVVSPKGKTVSKGLVSVGAISTEWE